MTRFKWRSIPVLFLSLLTACAGKQVLTDRYKAIETARQFASSDGYTLSEMYMKVWEQPETPEESLINDEPSDPESIEWFKEARGSETAWHVYFGPSDPYTAGGDVSIWVNIPGTKVVGVVRGK